jgi:undecaprenyl-diphosphatase
MINIFHSIILGAVQGLTEFLPISSSGHLVLIPYFFGWSYQGAAFDVALHAGTVIALLLYFWKDWFNILKSGLTGKPAADKNWQYKPNFLWQIVVASIPAGIVGLEINKYVDNIRSVILIAANLVVFGWLLWFIDKKAKVNLAPQEMSYGKAFIVGLFQSISLIPGVSRSGITITGSRLIGLPREEAARFSFLIGTPALAGALAIELPKIINYDLNFSFWIGIAASAVFGIAAINLLLAYLKKSDFSLFFWYRAAIAVLVVVFFLVRL